MSDHQQKNERSKRRSRKPVRKNLSFCIAGVGLITAALLFWPSRKDNIDYTDSSFVEKSAETVTVPENSETNESGGLIEKAEIVQEEEPYQEADDSTKEREPVSFVISFAGDCTLADDAENYGGGNGFLNTVGDNYAWPFENVAPYFQNDDLTFVNLEGVMCLDGYSTNGLFSFHAPEETVNCLLEGSVEMVTLANNHADDYGEDGLKGTKRVLRDAGVKYVEDRGTRVLVLTSREDPGISIKIGVYAANWPSEEGMEAELNGLRQRGADIVICAFHGGREGSYRPTEEQQEYAHMAIDLGADIVFGCHPHVLQPVEKYNGGIIYYSLGNFSFGGNTHPKDEDSAIIQQEILVEQDGNVLLGETEIIPCRLCSLDADRNDYRPTPYPLGSSAYGRTLRKLSGDYDGPDLYVDYGFVTME